MLPSEHRLLSGISDALKTLSTEDLSASAKSILAAAVIGVNELALRTQDDFFSGHCRRGAELLREGRGMPGRRRGSVPPPKSVPDSPLAVGDAAPASEEALRVQLTDLVRQLAAADADAEVSRYLSQIVDWENELYKARSLAATAIQDPPTKTPEAVTDETLRRYLTAKFPEWGTLDVANARVLQGGFSKKTVLFDVHDAVQGTRSLVMRAEQPDPLVFFEGARTAQEFRVLKLAWNAGLRVAEPLWHEADAALFGGNFLVSRKASGGNIGTAVGSSGEVTPQLMRDLVENLVRIHETYVDPDDENVRQSHLAHWSAFPTLEASTRENVAYWEREVRRMSLPASPLTVRALEWLARNVPRCDDPPCFVHRDYGLHNVLVEGDRVTCILDWESATVGDPAEELSWFINALPGAFDRHYVLDLYAKVSGHGIPESRVRYFDVFNALKFAVTCSLALAIFERNRGSSMDLCRLGLLYMHHGTSKLNDAIEKAHANV